MAPEEDILQDIADLGGHGFMPYITFSGSLDAKYYGKRLHEEFNQRKLQMIKERIVSTTAKRREAAAAEQAAAEAAADAAIFAENEELKGYTLEKHHGGSRGGYAIMTRYHEEISVPRHAANRVMFDEKWPKDVAVIFEEESMRDGISARLSWVHEVTTIANAPALVMFSWHAEAIKAVTQAYIAENQPQSDGTDAN
jgi:hypothetical protein